MRTGLVVGALLAGACGRAEPPRPPPGTQQRRAEVAVPGLAWAADHALAADATGAHAFVEDTGAVVEIDWQAATASRHAGLTLPGPGPLLVREDAGQADRIAWPGVAERPIPGGVYAWQLALDPGAVVPLVSTTPHREIVLDGWRADGSNAWHVELPGRGLEVRLLAHLGDLVLVQAAGAYTPADGWTGLTVALDAATGAVRWRQEPAGRDFPAAHHARAHGDEVALIYESRVDVIARGDGTLRRRVALDRSWMSIADQVGFDGDVVWSFAYDPPHDNPGDHMLGTYPRAPSPARCTYLVYDTRHDRGAPLRSGADARGEAREWLVDCTAHALMPLADGGAQLLVIPQDGVLLAIWFDRAP